MNNSRRQFIKKMSHLALSHQALSALSISPLLLKSSMAMAANNADPEARFLLIRCHEAMDSTLGLHPVDHDISGLAPQDLFLAYDPLKEVLQGYGEIKLGRSAEAILPFTNQMAIVRGIYVGPNDLGHPFAIQHMTSGRTQESAPSWSSYVADYLRTSGEYLVANTALQVGKLKQLPILQTSILQSQVGSMMGQASGGLGLYKNPNLGVGQFLEFVKQKEKMDRYVEFYKRATAANPEFLDEDVVVASLYAGLSRVAQLDLSSPRFSLMDNHAAYEANHYSAQKQRWDVIAKVLKNLRELNLLDKTLVVVVSEFNRTPGMNDNGGKDHNYSDNAVALFGRGIQGGSVIGDRELFTRGDGFPYAYWAGSFIDLGQNGKGSGEKILVKEGQAVPAGVDLIRPGDVWKSVAASLNSKLMHLAPEEASILPKILKV